MVLGKSKEIFPPVKVNYGQHVFGKDRAAYILNPFFIHKENKINYFFCKSIYSIYKLHRNRVFLMSLYPQVNSEDKSVCTKHRGFFFTILEDYGRTTK